MSTENTSIVKAVWAKVHIASFTCGGLAGWFGQPVIDIIQNLLG